MTTPHESRSILPGIIVLTAVLLTSSAVLILQFSKTQVQEPQLMQTSLLEPIQKETELSEAEIWMQSGEWLKAREALLKITETNSTDGRALEKLVEAELRLGLQEEARGHLDELKAQGNDSTEIQILELQWVALKGQSNEELKKILEPIAEDSQAVYYSSLLNLIEDPENWDASQAEKEANKGGLKKDSWLKIQAAVDAFNQESDGQKNYRDALIMKALLENEDHAWAARLGQRLLKSEPNYRDIWVMMGYADLQMRDFASASAALKSALDIDPVHAEARYLLGVSLLFQNSWPEAARAFELSILHGYQPQTDAYRKLAEAQTQAKQYSAALETYEYLFTLNQEPLETYLNPIWLALGPLKDPARARTLAEEAAQKYPDSAESHSLLAWVLLSEGDFTGSAEEVNSAFRKNRQLPDCYFVAGMLEESRKNPLSAQEHYEKVLRLSESSSLLYQLATERLTALTQPKSE